MVTPILEDMLRLGVAAARGAPRAEEETMMETVEFLGKDALFKYVGQEVLEKLASQIQTVSVAQTEVIRESDPVDGLYTIRSGTAKVTKTGEGGESEAVLAILGRGDSFGEIGLIDGLSRIANVTAMEPMRCYFLPRDALLAALEEHPEIARAMLPSLASMVRSADRWIAQLL